MTLTALQRLVRWSPILTHEERRYWQENLATMTKTQLEKLYSILSLTPRA